MKPDPKLVEQLVEIITHEVLAAMMEEETRASNPKAISANSIAPIGLCVRVCYRPGRQRGQRGGGDGCRPRWG